MTRFASTEWFVFATLGTLSIAVLASGCGGAGLVPVEGVVTLDGKPLSGATIRLDRSTGPVSERSFVGETDAQGHFAVGPIESDKKGAIPDTYRVFITSVTVPADANEMTKLPPERVPVQFRNGSEVLEISTDGTTEANFAMTSR
jgi:hypothetical protein